MPKIIVPWFHKPRHSERTWRRGRGGQSAWASWPILGLRWNPLWWEPVWEPVWELWLVGGLEHEFYFFPYTYILYTVLGISSSQLTWSIFFRWAGGSTTNQMRSDKIRSKWGMIRGCWHLKWPVSDAIVSSRWYPLVMTNSLPWEMAHL